MNRQNAKKLTLWLTGLLAVLVLAACGQTPPDNGGPDNTSTLTVTVNGDGAVTSDVGGLNCTSAGEDTCAVTVDNGTEVALAAAADAEATFDGWAGGGCEGTDLVCTVTVDADTTVTANFSGAVADETDYRAAQAAVDGTGPVLVVTVAGTPLSFPITTVENDAEELNNASGSNPTAFPAGFTYTDSSDLDLVYDTSHSTSQHVGLRFPNVTIAATDTIDSAHIVFTADAEDPGNGNPVSLTIAGQAAGNPDAFNNDPDGDPSSDISSRALTTATVDWDITEAWTGGAEIQSADVTPIVQELIALGDWASGNAMAFVITGAAASAE